MEPEGTLQREPNWELLVSREIPPRDHGLRAGWGAEQLGSARAGTWQGQPHDIHIACRKAEYL